MKTVVIIGAGGFGRQILSVFEDCNKNAMEYDVLGFIVNSQYGKQGDLVDDKPILGDLSWLECNSRDVYAICALGEPHQRRRMIEIIQRTGVRFCTVIHPSTIMTRWITIGEGVFIGQGNILGHQIRIGNHVVITGACTVGHDVVIEDFVTIFPGVHVSGNDTIHEGSSIGVGTNIIEIAVGAWSVVGAGTTIAKDILENTTVVGVPGKVIKTRPAGWQNQSDGEAL
jgi:sugar O-acyltransferase (sialic acid O-acetyltransferase NeuD family)